MNKKEKKLKSQFLMWIAQDTLNITLSVFRKGERFVNLMWGIMPAELLKQAGVQGDHAGDAWPAVVTMSWGTDPNHMFTMEVESIDEESELEDKSRCLIAKQVEAGYDSLFVPKDLVLDMTLKMIELMMDTNVEGSGVCRTSTN